LDLEDYVSRLFAQNDFFKQDWHGNCLKEELTSKEETTDDGTDVVGRIDQTNFVSILVASQQIVCSGSTPNIRGYP
jgi:hypothetical protein